MTAWSYTEMQFGKRVRDLSQKKRWTLRDLSERVGVGITYLSRVENEHLHSGDYPSDALIHKLADALDTDEDEFLVLAKRVPERIRERVLQRPDVFRVLAECDDKTLDRLMGEISGKATKRK